MNKFDFEELIEKAFSMGYEYALAEVEEKYFSEDEDDDEKPKKKISLGDRMDIWTYKNLMSKKGRKEAIEDLDEKESVLKASKRHIIRDAKRGAIGGALAGGAIGYFGSKDDTKSERVKNTLKYMAGGALGGAAFEGGTGSIAYPLAIAGRRSLRKVSSSYDKAARKNQDKLKVADGQMSREEFAKKWGK